MKDLYLDFPLDVDRDPGAQRTSGESFSDLGFQSAVLLYAACGVW